MNTQITAAKKSKPMKLLYKHKFKLVSLLLIAIATYYIKPVYDSFAHRGKVPLPPFGWHSIPDDSPVTSRVINANYNNAAERVISAMQERQKLIGAASYSVAVGIKGELVWAGAAGWANIKNKVKATPDTRYRVGSTSKAITATALTQLVQKGIINLDTPISEYIDNLPNKDWETITPRMLASHMAGLSHYAQKGVQKDYLGLYQVMALTKDYSSMVDALEVFDGTSLRSTPGTEFYYSSLGTVLLGAVIEGATGKLFSEIVTEYVLLPNEMHSTIVAPTSSDGHINVATSYINRVNDNTHEVRQWRPLDLSHRLPGGGFAATSSDLVKLGLSYFNEDYIANETKNIFWAPQKLANGETNPQNYALSWRFYTSNIEGIGEFSHANHGGVSRGAQSWLMVIPDYEMVIAINANIKTKNFSDFAIIYKDVITAFKN